MVNPRNARERAWDRYQRQNPNPSNNECRAYCLLDLCVTDNSGGMDFLDLNDDWFLPLIELARQIRDDLRQLEAEEKTRGELRLIDGGRP